MSDIHSTYEARLIRHILRTNNRIKRIYEGAIREITIGISTVRFKGILFSLKDYPILQRRIELTLREMNRSLYAVYVNSIENSWLLANDKNNLLIDQRLAGRRPAKKVRKIIYDPNIRSLNTFIDRKEKGMNLSDRVWNLTITFKHELEQTLGFGIAKGQSAASIASDVKKYLNRPNDLFRRVRSEEGKLVLSQAARNYHPGRGVYRSSYKNALRLTATENNMAYRTADFERWNRLPFVIGIEVRLSNNHPRFDICDHLAGKYPKTFLFRGWHPFCRCNAIPVMASDQEYEKIEDAILAGEPIDTNIPGTIHNTPPGFNKWIRENADRVNGWKNKPYFMRDNKQHLSQ